MAYILYTKDQNGNPVYKYSHDPYEDPVLNIPTIEGILDSFVVYTASGPSRGLPDMGDKFISALIKKGISLGKLIPSIEKFYDYIRRSDFVCLLARAARIDPDYVKNTLLTLFKRARSFKEHSSFIDSLSIFGKAFASTELKSFGVALNDVEKIYDIIKEVASSLKAPGVPPPVDVRLKEKFQIGKKLSEEWSRIKPVEKIRLGDREVDLATAVLEYFQKEPFSITDALGILASEEELGKIRGLLRFKNPPNNVVDAGYLLMEVFGKPAEEAAVEFLNMSFIQFYMTSRNIQKTNDPIKDAFNVLKEMYKDFEKAKRFGKFSLKQILEAYISEFIYKNRDVLRAIYDYYSQYYMDPLEVVNYSNMLDNIWEHVESLVKPKDVSNIVDYDLLKNETMNIASQYLLKVL
ncbi:MAG: hypothetical protein QXI58_03760 [Candidatus Micrarchaeia archaeon]